MDKLKKILLPIAVIIVAIIISRVMISNRAPAERQAPRAPAPAVKVMTVESSDYAVWVTSRGEVQARTQATLVAQVGGEVVRVNSNFRDGGYFSANEVLLQIDPRDYRSAVTIAEAEKIRAQQMLAEEEARSAQAARDWERLGGTELPSDLTLRKPQLDSARANLAAAEARLAQAKLNLSRTRISVPYDGRVLSQKVDIGQVVNPGLVLGEVYATDAVEVRLPLSNRHLAQLSIPEQYRDQDRSEPGPVVKISAQVGDQRHEWQGRIVRSEGAIDNSSRQTFVVASIDDPYASNEAGRPPLKVGQYVEAEIEGRTLRDVLVIPASAIKGEVFAYVLDEEKRLVERALDVVWRSGNEVVVAAGIKAGEQLVTTLPAGAVQGMQVRLPGDKPPQQEQAAP